MEGKKIDKTVKIEDYAIETLLGVGNPFFI